MKAATSRRTPNPSRFLFIHQPEAVQNQVRVTRRFNRHRKRLRGLLEFKRAGGDFDNLTKGIVSDQLAALCAHDLAVIEKHAPRLRVVPEHQRSRQSRVLDRLNCVEHADGGEVAGECHIGFVLLWRGSRWRR